jgi:AhpD family alkylhydroperoxidase
MSNAIPTGRIQLQELAARPSGAMFRLSASIELDHGLRHLLDIRASQINGCAFCLDMHWKDAKAAGESDERLYMLPAWRESPLYSLASTGQCTTPDVADCVIPSGRCRAKAVGRSEVCLARTLRSEVEVLFWSPIGGIQHRR